MKSGTFMDLVSIHYNDIKRLYTSRDVNNNKRFCEDSFNDAFIKCAKRFGNDIITYDDAVKYFYVAYVNTHKGSCKTEIDNVFESIDNINEDIPDDEDPEYKKYAKYMYDITMAAISEKYGKTDMMVYSLYKYHNWTEKELISAGYNCTNLKEKIKEIHSFVKKYHKNSVNPFKER